MISGMLNWWYKSGDVRIFYIFLPQYIAIVSFLTYMRLFNNELEDKFISLKGDTSPTISLFFLCLIPLPILLFFVYVVSPIVILLTPIALIAVILAKLIDLSVKTVKKNSRKSFQEINEAYEKLLKEIEELKAMDKKE